MDFVLPPCLTTRAAPALPAGDGVGRSGRRRTPTKDAAMPVAKGLLQQCHLQCQKGEACETLAARVTEWRESPPGRLPSSRSSWEPVPAGARPASGLREALESLPAAHFLLCEEAPPQRVERPCLHAAPPSGPYSYVLDVWGSLCFAPGPHQLRHRAATPDAAGTPVLAPDPTATKAWRPRAPSSPSTTTARP